MIPFSLSLYKDWSENICTGVHDHLIALVSIFQRNVIVNDIDFSLVRWTRWLKI